MRLYERRVFALSTFRHGVFMLAYNDDYSTN